MSTAVFRIDDEVDVANGESIIADGESAAGSEAWKACALSIVVDAIAIATSADGIT